MRCTRRRTARVFEMDDRWFRLGDHEVIPLEITDTNENELDFDCKTRSDETID